MNRVFAIAAVAALLVAVGTIGYLVGVNGAPDDAEAQLAQEADFRSAASRAERVAFVKARRAAVEVGVANGERRGSRLGTKRGAAAGEAAAKAKAKRLAEEREALENAEREAAEQAEAETAAETRYCNVPLFIDGYCPTQAEIEQENQAEGEAGLGD